MCIPIFACSSLFPDLQASGSLPFQKSAAAVDKPLTNPVTTRKPYLHVQPFQNQISENTKTKPLSPVPKSLLSVLKLVSQGKATSTN